MSKATVVGSQEEQQEQEETEEEEEDEEEDFFYESHDRLLSLSSSCSCSNSDKDEEQQQPEPQPQDPNYHFALNSYDIWISHPSSVSERRTRLLQTIGLSSDPSLSRGNPLPPHNAMFRSKSDGYSPPSHPQPPHNHNSDFNPSHSHSLSSSSSSSLSLHSATSSNCLPANSAASPAKPPSGKNFNSSRRSLSNVDFAAGTSSAGTSSAVPEASAEATAEATTEATTEAEVKCGEVEIRNEQACTIRDLDNGTEFVVKEVREDGKWNKVKEVGTGRQLTMEEFEMTVGHSPIVQELMRRQNVEEDPGNGGGGGGGSSNNGNNFNSSKMKKKGGSWLKSIKSAMAGHKERRSSDERDTSSEKGGRRSSSATDDSQEGTFHGPERVRVRQYGKSCKELTALFKSQEIQAHNGSIWSIKFSLDGKYLASAGEDCVIHVWQVVESERKGELLLMEKQEDVNVNMLFLVNGSPEPALLSPLGDNLPERKRKGRSSISRKSLSLEQFVVPETVFALSEKPICSFQGHLHDVLDLSWSKSQHLLSSSMDKTVRLWHLSSKSCLKIFSHSDYVTCIQFNPVDDRYFISGSLDAKVRIWSIPDRQVVDWSDLHEMVTAACYTPDGQGALVGSYKGSCHLYNTSENKLQQKSQINLQNKKKRSHHKKITGFQFAPGSSSEVLITSADSRVRVVDGVDLVHKFKGFRNATSSISASLTANGKYIVAASEDSHVYVWKNEADCRPNRSKGVTVTRSYEHFHCKDVSVAIPWPGMGDAWDMHDAISGEQPELENNADEVTSANHPPTPVEENFGADGLRTASGFNSPHHATIASAANNYFFDRISATWPEEKLVLAARNQSPRVSMDFSNGVSPKMSAWGMVIVTAGLRGEIRTFQNFGLPLRI